MGSTGLSMVRGRSADHLSHSQREAGRPIRTSRPLNSHLIAATQDTLSSISKAVGETCQKTIEDAQRAYYTLPAVQDVRSEKPETYFDILPAEVFKGISEQLEEEKDFLAFTEALPKHASSIYKPKKVG